MAAKPFLSLSSCCLNHGLLTPSRRTVIARLRERVEVTVIDSLGFSVAFIKNVVFPKPRHPVVIAIVVIHHFRNPCIRRSG
jgi:hypothetical protein